jgi:hypothetical protein
LCVIGAIQSCSNSTVQHRAVATALLVLLSARALFSVSCLVYFCRTAGAINLFNAEFNPNYVRIYLYVRISSPYRAVNTLLLGYKNQTGNAVQ